MQIAKSMLFLVQFIECWADGSGKMMQLMIISDLSSFGRSDVLAETFLYRHSHADDSPLHESGSLTHSVYIWSTVLPTGED